MAGRIVAVGLADGDVVEGGVFVDASYEGDLLALAGVPYAVGSGEPVPARRALGRVGRS